MRKTLVTLSLFVLGLLSATAQGQISSYGGQVLYRQDVGANGQPSGTPTFVVLAPSRDGRSLIPVMGEIGGYKLNFDGSDAVEHNFDLVAAISGFEMRRTFRPPEIEPDLQAYAKALQVATTQLNNLDVKTSVQTEKDTLLVTQFITSTSRFAVKRVFRLWKAAAFANVKIEPASVVTSQPQRFAADVAPAPFRALAPSVVQISAETSSPQADASLGQVIVPASRASGFFLSRDGIMATNYHVVNHFYACQVAMRCQMQFRQIDAADLTRFNHFSASADILVMDARHDFALLKVLLPKDTKIRPLALSNHIGPQLLTFGFPFDRKAADGQIDLTFSVGGLSEFLGNGFATSLFAGSGASGSPVLNQDDLKLMGIATQVLVDNKFVGDTGSGFTVVHSLHVLDAEFGISQYLTGSKQNRINQIVDQVATAANLGVVKAALQNYENEKTVFGYARLKTAMIQHPQVSVRNEILKFFESHDWIRR